jgi:hypothetical protein
MPKHKSVILAGVILIVLGLGLTVMYVTAPRSSGYPETYQRWFDGFPLKGFLGVKWGGHEIIAIGVILTGAGAITVVTGLLMKPSADVQQQK